MATKKYEVGGMTEAASCAGPNKPPRCKQKFKSKGKSKETKGSILGTLGAIAGGLGGYAAYKKLKEQQKGGTTKYQKGGSAPHGPGSMTHGTVPPMVNEPAKSKKLKVKDLVINTEGAKKAKQNAMKRQLRKHQNGGASDPIKAMYKAKGEKMPTTKKTLKYVSKNSSGYNAPKSAVDTSVWKERPGRTPDSKTYQKGGTTKPTPKRTTVPKKYVDSAIPTYKGPDAPMPKTARAQKGGITKKYQDGGANKKSYTPFEYYMKTTPGATASDTSQVFTGSINSGNPKLDKAYYDTYYAGRENEKRSGRDEVKYDDQGKRVRYKTGGMVNPNAKLQAAKAAGSKGVKPGVNPKAAASKVARGRSGGTSVAPKTAVPKAKYGLSITKMKKK